MNAPPVRRFIINGQLRPLPPLNPARRARVDLIHDPRDFLVALYGSLGFSTTCIAEATKLSPSQIIYRLKKAKVSRQDYRNGHSPMAKLVMQRTNDSAPRLMWRHINTLQLPAHGEGPKTQ